MAKEVFNRIEKKYILEKQQYEDLMEELQNYINPDSFAYSLICNIYYDTQDYELIRNSLEKPIYKEKVRLRSYGVPKIDDKVFLEIKKKYKGVVNKRRIELTLKEAYEYLKGKEITNQNEQIKKEIDYCFKKYNLQPVMFLSYERNSYVGKEDENFRITFDTNIKSRDYDLQLEKGAYGEKITTNQMYIMEVKTLGALPMWFVKILSKNKIYPGTFSKYGKAYQKNIQIIKENSNEMNSKIKRINSLRRNKKCLKVF